MNYLVKSTGRLVLVALGLRVAAWLMAPAVPVLIGLFITLAVFSALLLPNFWGRQGS